MSLSSPDSFICVHGVIDRPFMLCHCAGAAHHHKGTMMDYQALFLTAQGRINRLTYLTGFAIIFVVDLVLQAIAYATSQHAGLIATLMAILSIVLIYPGICIGIKRFHDRDKSGWWVLIALIPFIGWIWYLIEVFFLPGTRGPNKYGPDTVTA